MQAVLWEIVLWILQELVVKSAVVMSIFAAINLLLPMVLDALSPWNANVFNNAFGAIPPGMWYFLDLFRLDFGLPLVIAAYISRFVIRRLPVIG
jgi:hypothetical protein